MDTQGVRIMTTKSNCSSTGVMTDFKLRFISNPTEFVLEGTPTVSYLLRTCISYMSYK